MAHDPATCPCNKCVAKRAEDRVNAAVDRAKGAVPEGVRRPGASGTWEKVETQNTLPFVVHRLPVPNGWLYLTEYMSPGREGGPDRYYAMQTFVPGESQ